jgi:hypothetical protein
MKKAENAGLMYRKPEKTIQEMMVAIGDSLSHLESSDDGQDGDDEDDDERVLGKWSNDDAPGRVMGTITGMVQWRLELFQQK